MLHQLRCPSKSAQVLPPRPVTLPATQIGLDESENGADPAPATKLFASLQATDTTLPADVVRAYPVSVKVKIVPVVTVVAADSSKVMPLTDATVTAPPEILEPVTTMPG